MGQKYTRWLEKLGHDCVIFDPLINRAEYPNLNIFSELNCKEILNCKKAIIATPPKTHFELARFFLEKKISILIEKPIELDLSLVKKIICLSQLMGVTAYGVANMRNHIGYTTIKKYIKNKEILHISSWFSHRLSQMRTGGLGEYAKDRDESGGILLDCIHDLDLMMSIMGVPDKVSQSINNTDFEGLSVEDSAELIFHWKSKKVMGKLSIDYLSPQKRRGIRVITSDELVEWNSFGKEPEEVIVRSRTNHSDNFLLHLESYDSQEMFMKMVNDFLTDSEELQTIEEALNVLEVAALAENSLKTCK